MIKNEILKKSKNTAAVPTDYVFRKYRKFYTIYAKSIQPTLCAISSSPIGQTVPVESIYPIRPLWSDEFLKLPVLRLHYELFMRIDNFRSALDDVIGGGGE